MLLLLAVLAGPALLAPPATAEGPPQSEDRAEVVPPDPGGADAEDGAPESVANETETREEELRQERLAKPASPGRPGLVERIMIAAQDNTPLPLVMVPVHSFYLRPGTLRSGGGVALSVEYWDAERKGACLSAARPSASSRSPA